MPTEPVIFLLWVGGVVLVLLYLVCVWRASGAGPTTSCSSGWVGSSNGTTGDEQALRLPLPLGSALA